MTSMSLNCGLALAVICLVQPCRALVECTGNSCFTSCASRIVERNTGRCVSGSAQQDLCTCSVQEWQCTAQCGCFQRGVCDAQQNDWGNRCTLNCPQLANIPGATAGPPSYGFLSFDSNDSTYYVLDILFVLLAILLACCCLGLLISCCLVCYSLLTGGRRQVAYTDAAGRPISPLSSRRSSPASFIGSPHVVPTGAYPYTATAMGMPMGVHCEGAYPATATAYPFATAHQGVAMPYATAHQGVPLTYTTIASPGTITPTRAALASPLGSPVQFVSVPHLGSPVHHMPAQGIPLDMATLAGLAARSESQLLHSPLTSPVTTTAVKTTRKFL